MWFFFTVNRSQNLGTKFAIRSINSFSLHLSNQIVELLIPSLIYVSHTSLGTLNDFPHLGSHLVDVDSRGEVEDFQ